jgi:hypothetical protein
MAYTRQIPLGWIHNKTMFFLECKLTECANIASLSIYLHRHSEMPLGLNPQVEIAVDVWSSNRGSVDDYCDFYLSQIEASDRSIEKIDCISETYKERVRNWLIHNQSRV